MYKSFNKGKWNSTIDVRDFIQKNYTPYDGDDSFLTEPTKTLVLWAKVKELMEQERAKGGVLDIDTHTISTIASHKPGYIDKPNEEIVGLQTDEPLKEPLCHLVESEWLRPL